MVQEFSGSGDHTIPLSSRWLNGLFLYAYAAEIYLDILVPFFKLILFEPFPERFFFIRSNFQ